MVNRNYVKGVRFERQIVKELELNGYFAVRTAGSHSCIDVIGVKHGEVLLIQAKTTLKKNLDRVVEEVGRTELNEDFVSQVFGKNVFIEIWVKGPGKNNVLKWGVV